MRRCRRPFPAAHSPLPLNSSAQVRHEALRRTLHVTHSLRDPALLDAPTAALSPDSQHHLAQSHSASALPAVRAPRRRAGKHGGDAVLRRRLRRERARAAMAEERGGRNQEGDRTQGLATLSSADVRHLWAVEDLRAQADRSRRSRASSGTEQGGPGGGEGAYGTDTAAPSPSTGQQDPLHPEAAEDRELGVDLRPGRALDPIRARVASEVQALEASARQARSRMQRTAGGGFDIVRGPHGAGAGSAAPWRRELEGERLQAHRQWRRHAVESAHALRQESGPVPASSVAHAPLGPSAARREAARRVLEDEDAAGTAEAWCDEDTLLQCELPSTEKKHSARPPRSTEEGTEPTTASTHGAPPGPAQTGVELAAATSAAVGEAAVREDADKVGAETEAVNTAQARIREALRSPTAEAPDSSFPPLSREANARLHARITGAHGTGQWRDDVSSQLARPLSASALLAPAHPGAAVRNADVCPHGVPTAQEGVMCVACELHRRAQERVQHGEPAPTTQGLSWEWAVQQRAPSLRDAWLGLARAPDNSMNARWNASEATPAPLLRFVAEAEAAVTLVQRLWRRRLERRVAQAALHAQRADKASRALQRVWRRRQQTAARTEEAVLRHRAATLVQAPVRGFIARTRFQYTRTARAIQRVWRGVWARWCVAEHRRRIRASIEVQRLWRGSRGRWRAHARRRWLASIEVQRTWRGYIGRILAIFRRQEVVATRRTGAMLGRAYVAHNLLRQAAAVPLQRHWRGVAGRRFARWHRGQVAAREAVRRRVEDELARRAGRLSVSLLRQDMGTGHGRHRLRCETARQESLRHSRERARRHLAPRESGLLEARMLFEALDVDADEGLSWDEFRGMLRRVRAPRLHGPDLRTLWRDLDCNGDGVIKFAEFYRWFTAPDASAPWLQPPGGVGRGGHRPPHEEPPQDRGARLAAWLNPLLRLKLRSLVRAEAATGHLDRVLATRALVGVFRAEGSANQRTAFRASWPPPFSCRHCLRAFAFAHQREAHDATRCLDAWRPAPSPWDAVFFGAEDDRRRVVAGMASLGEPVAAVIRAMEGPQPTAAGATAERALVRASAVQGKQQGAAGRRGSLSGRWASRRNSQAAFTGVRAAALDAGPTRGAAASAARRAAVRDRIDDAESTLRERRSAGGATFELSGPDVGRERLSARALAAVSWEAQQLTASADDSALGGPSTGHAHRAEDGTWLASEEESVARAAEERAAAAVLTLMRREELERATVAAFAGALPSAPSGQQAWCKGGGAAQRPTSAEAEAQGPTKLAALLGRAARGGRDEDEASPPRPAAPAAHPSHSRRPSSSVPRRRPATGLSHGSTRHVSFAAGEAPRERQRPQTAAPGRRSPQPILKGGTLPTTRPRPRSERGRRGPSSPVAEVPDTEAREGDAASLSSRPSSGASHAPRLALPAHPRAVDPSVVVAVRDKPLHATGSPSLAAQLHVTVGHDPDQGAVNAGRAARAAEDIEMRSRCAALALGLTRTAHSDRGADVVRIVHRRVAAQWRAVRRPPHSVAFAPGRAVLGLRQRRRCMWREAKSWGVVDDVVSPPSDAASLTGDGEAAAPMEHAGREAQRRQRPRSGQSASSSTAAPSGVATPPSTPGPASGRSLLRAADGAAASTAGDGPLGAARLASGAGASAFWARARKGVLASAAAKLRPGAARPQSGVSTASQAVFTPQQRSRTDCEVLFRAFDLDSSGTLHREEVAYMLDRLRLPVHAVWDVDRVIAAVGSGAAGFTLAQLVAWYTAPAPGVDWAVGPGDDASPLDEPWRNELTRLAAANAKPAAAPHASDPRRSSLEALHRHPVRLSGADLGGSVLLGHRGSSGYGGDWQGHELGGDTAGSPTRGSRTGTVVGATPSALRRRLRSVGWEEEDAAKVIPPFVGPPTDLGAGGGILYCDGMERHSLLAVVLELEGVPSKRLPVRDPPLWPAAELKLQMRRACRASSGRGAHDPIPARPVSGPGEARPGLPDWAGEHAAVPSDADSPTPLAAPPSSSPRMPPRNQESSFSLYSAPAQPRERGAGLVHDPTPSPADTADEGGALAFTPSQESASSGEHGSVATLATLRTRALPSAGGRAAASSDTQPSAPLPEGGGDHHSPRLQRTTTSLRRGLMREPSVALSLPSGSSAECTPGAHVPVAGEGGTTPPDHASSSTGQASSGHGTPAPDTAMKQTLSALPVVESMVGAFVRRRRRTDPLGALRTRMRELAVWRTQRLPPTMAPPRPEGWRTLVAQAKRVARRRAVARYRLAHQPPHPCALCADAFGRRDQLWAHVQRCHAAAARGPVGSRIQQAEGGVTATPQGSTQRTAVVQQGAVSTRRMPGPLSHRGAGSSRPLRSAGAAIMGPATRVDPGPGAGATTSPVARAVAFPGAGSPQLPSTPRQRRRAPQRGMARLTQAQEPGDGDQWSSTAERTFAEASAAACERALLGAVARALPPEELEALSAPLRALLDEAEDGEQTGPTSTLPHDEWGQLLEMMERVEDTRRRREQWWLSREERWVERFRRTFSTLETDAGEGRIAAARLETLLRECAIASRLEPGDNAALQRMLDGTGTGSVSHARTVRWLQRGASVRGVRATWPRALQPASVVALRAREEKRRVEAAVAAVEETPGVFPRRRLVRGMRRDAAREGEEEEEVKGQRGEDPFPSCGPRAAAAQRADAGLRTGVIEAAVHAARTQVRRTAWTAALTAFRRRRPPRHVCPKCGAPFEQHGALVVHLEAEGYDVRSPALFVWRQEEEEEVGAICATVAAQRAGAYLTSPRGRAHLAERARRAQAEIRRRKRRLSRAEAVEEGVRELFDAFDLDGSGDIDRGELPALLAAMQKRLTAAEVDDVMAAMDRDGSGDVDYSEFRAWLRHDEALHRRSAAVARVRRRVVGGVQRVAAGFAALGAPPFGATSRRRHAMVVHMASHAARLGAGDVLRQGAALALRAFAAAWAASHQASPTLCRLGEAGLLDAEGHDAGTEAASPVLVAAGEAAGPTEEGSATPPHTSSTPPAPQAEAAHGSPQGPTGGAVDATAAAEAASRVPNPLAQSAESASSDFTPPSNPYERQRLRFHALAAKQLSRDRAERARAAGVASYRRLCGLSPGQDPREMERRDIFRAAEAEHARRVLSWTQRHRDDLPAPGPDGWLDPSAVVRHAICELLHSGGAPGSAYSPATDHARSTHVAAAFASTAEGATTLAATAVVGVADAVPTPSIL